MFPSSSSVSTRDHHPVRVRGAVPDAPQTAGAAALGQTATASGGTPRRVVLAASPTRVVLAASPGVALAASPTRVVLAASPPGFYKAVPDPEDDGPAAEVTPDGRAHEPGASGAPAEAAPTSPTSPWTSEAPEMAAETDLETELDALRERASMLAGSVPEQANPTQVDAWLASFRRLEGAMAGLRTRLVACVQSSRAHEGGGHAAPTTYLKQTLGISGREAARHDRLARDLRGLPRTQAALSSGEIGPEQAQAIGRSARDGVLGDPGETEAKLLPIARERGADDLYKEIRRLELEADRRSLERAERRAYRRRRGTLVRRNDGMWDLYALLPDEHGEALATALDAFRTFDPPETPIPQQRSPEQRTADAITDLVRAAVQSGNAPTSGGALPQLNIVVPIEALDPDGTAAGELAHGGALSPAALDRLLCDANLRRLITRGDSEVLDTGRTRRQWSVAQRQALRLRDGGCRGPGCDRPANWTHAHHLVPWSKDGPTAVDNGLLLCSFHHHQVHEGGWTVSFDPVTAEATFTSPSGREITTQPHRPAGTRHAAGEQSDPLDAGTGAATTTPSAGPSSSTPPSGPSGPAVNGGQTAPSDTRELRPSTAERANGANVPDSMDEAGGLDSTDGADAAGGLDAINSADAAGGLDSTDGADAAGGLDAINSADAAGGLDATDGADAAGGLDAINSADAVHDRHGFDDDPGAANAARSMPQTADPIPLTLDLNHISMQETVRGDDDGTAAASDADPTGRAPP